MAKNKVVIVDDEFWIIKGFEKTFDFEKYGFEVALATTKPNDAIDFILNNDIDVVFVDIKMSCMTGFELIDTVQANGKDPCFIIVSGYDDYEYMRSAIKHKVFDYCLKPIVRENAEKILINLREHFGTEDSEAFVQTDTKIIDNANFSKLIEYINNHYQEKLLLKNIADMFFYNPNYLCMLFNKYFKKTYSQYLLGLRLEKAHELLTEKQVSAYDAAISVGFSNYSYFKKKYLQYWGETPANSRKGTNTGSK